MSVLYKAKMVNPGIKSGKEITYMATIVPQKQVDFADICKAITDSSTHTESDVVGVVLAIVKMLERNLSHGHSVKIGDLGIFSISITSPQVNDPHKLNARDVQVKNINFLPSPRLKMAMELVEFEHV